MEGQQVYALMILGGEDGFSLADVAAEEAVSNTLLDSGPFATC